MSCAQCGKRIDLSRTHGPGDGDDWCSTRVSMHGNDFCSGACADAWEVDPANADAVADSHRRARCSAYVECVMAALMRDVMRVSPRFASCDADCPLRETVVVRSRA